MRNLFFFILLSLFSFLPSKAQITFQKQYGDAAFYDVSLSGQQTSTGGYILSFQSDSLGSIDMGMMKTDLFGNVIWKKFYGTAGADIGTFARETSDGGFILTGGWDGFGNDSVVLIKTDVNGNLQWQKLYTPTSGRSVGQYVVQTSDGGYAVAGFTGSGSSEKMFLFKTDASGNLSWTKTYGAINGGEGYCVHEIPGVGFILSGTYTSATSSDLWLVRTNNIGDTLWTRTNGTAQDEVGYKCWRNSDGGFVMTGFGYHSGGDIFLWRTDANGNTIWTKTFDDGGWEEAYGVVQTSDGGFAMTGRSGNPSHYDDGWLIRTDGNGTMIWNRYFHSSLMSEFSDIAQTSDGGFILAGDRVDSSNFNENMFLVKTGPAGYVGVNEILSPNEDEFSVFPNPASAFSEIHFSAALPGRRIRLSDMNGKILIDEETDSEIYRMNLAEISNGIYVVSVISENGISSKRIIVAH
jgi:hypothetical protein